MHSIDIILKNIKFIVSTIYWNNLNFRINFISKIILIIIFFSGFGIAIIIYFSM